MSNRSSSCLVTVHSWALKMEIPYQLQFPGFFFLIIGGILFTIDVVSSMFMPGLAQFMRLFASVCVGLLVSRLCASASACVCVCVCLRLRLLASASVCVCPRLHLCACACACAWDSSLIRVIHRSIQLINLTCLK